MPIVGGDKPGQMVFRQLNAMMLEEIGGDGPVGASSGRDIDFMPGNAEEFRQSSFHAELAGPAGQQQGSIDIKQADSRSHRKSSGQ
jgi:hypothetical protein